MSEKDKSEPSTEPTEPKLNTKEEKYRYILINELRHNSQFINYDLEKEDTMVLEAMYRAEQIRKNTETKDTIKPEKSLFTIAPIKHLKENEKKAKEMKENLKTPVRMNVFELFWPQYQDTERMCTFNDQCQILSLRVHPSNKVPHFQVS